MKRNTNLNNLERMDITPSGTSPQFKSKVDLRIDELNECKRQFDLQIQWLQKHREILEALSVAPSIYGFGIDFDHANRLQILEIIKALPGVWDKSINTTDTTKMDYTRRSTVEGEPTIRIWSGEPPPTCRVVEEWVDVPAQPATRVLKKVVRCQGEPALETEQV